MVSIIVPVYNAESTIVKCIDSILVQDQKDFELIIVDDGSTDESLTICKTYATHDDRIVCLSQPHQGVSAARNKGLKFARGKYITFVDSDDWIAPTHLINLTKRLGSSQLCITDMVMYPPQTSNTENTKTTSQQTTHYSLHIEDKELTDKADVVKSTRLYGSTCNALFLAYIIKDHKLQFDINISRGEDTDFLMRYTLYINRVSLSSAQTYHYMTPDNTKTYQSGNLLYSTIRIYENMLNLTDSLNESDRSDIMKTELLEDIDWAIEGLLFYPKEYRIQWPILVQKFGIYFYPYLHLSHRNSVRHRVFKHICISKSPSIIWLASHFAACLKK